MSSFAVLDLPKQSVVVLNGVPVVVKRDDFLGFTNIPTSSGFHLVCVRAAAISLRPDNLGSCGNPSATTCGFVMINQDVCLRRFDLTTEEVSPDEIDAITANNLRSSLQNRSIPPERLVPYQQFISEHNQQAWERRTNFISSKLLEKRGISGHDKLVPGAPPADDEGNASGGSQTVIDGHSARYPSIPIVKNDGVSQTRHTRHPGTRAFMKQLGPAARTKLFTCDCPGNEVFTMLFRDCYESNQSYLLGDLQLSFVLFINLQCFESLTHWCTLLALLANVNSHTRQSHKALYNDLYNVLNAQLEVLDEDLITDGLVDDTSLLETLRNLVSTEHGFEDNEDLMKLQNRLRQFVEPIHDSETRYSGENDNEDNPVIVSLENVEAALARDQAKPAYSRVEYPLHIRERFPILFSAMMHHEDVLMTCARALDEAKDVSLVREAAAYLEQVESTAR